MISQARLCECLHYDSETGVFTHLERPVRPEFVRTDRIWNTRFAGKEAGYARADQRGNQYRIVGIDWEQYSAHRLAVLYMTGRWPEDEVDHEDRNGLNNRWQNLRPCTGTQNQGNRKLNANNTTGLKGVGYDRRRKRFTAKIAVDRKRFFLGYFDTAEEAHAAYCEAAKEKFGAFARAA